MTIAKFEIGHPTPSTAGTVLRAGRNRESYGLTLVKPHWLTKKNVLTVLTTIQALLLTVELSDSFSLVKLVTVIKLLVELLL